MKNARFFSKIMSVVLAMAMVVSMLPMSVFATQTEIDVGTMSDDEVVALCVELAQAGDTAAIETVAAQLEADEDETRYARVEAMLMAELGIEEDEGEAAPLASDPATVTAYKQVDTYTDKQVDLKYYEYVGTADDLEAAAALLKGAAGGLIEVSEGTLTVTDRQDMSMSNLVIKGAGKSATIITGDADKFNNKTNGLNSNSLSSEFKALLGLSAENIKVMDMTIDGGSCGAYGFLNLTVKDFKTVRVNSGTAYLENLVISGKKASCSLMVGTSTSAATVYANGVTVNRPDHFLSSTTEQTYGSYLDAKGSLLEGVVLGSGADLGAGYYEVTYSGVTAYTTIPYAIEIYEKGMLTSGFVNAQTTAQGVTVAEAMTADLTSVIDGSTTLLYGKDCDEMKALADEFKTALAGVSDETGVVVTECLTALATALAIDSWHDVEADGTCATCGKTGLSVPAEKPSVDVEIPENIVVGGASGETVSAAVQAEIIDRVVNNNEAFKTGFTPTAEVEQLSVKATAMTVSNGVATKMTFDVTPMLNGVEADLSQAITFRLPVDASVAAATAAVFHEEELLGADYAIEGDENGKYVEVTSADFSLYTVDTEYEAVTYVAEVNGVEFASVIEALNYAVENSASQVVLLTNSREVMPTDVELLLKADLKIVSATGEAVAAKFYNNGTSYDFIFNSADNSNSTLTIGENVTFQLEDRVIWAGYYGNDVDVVVEGTLAGYQYWHGADTTVNATGTLKTTGEALVMRRGATLTVDGGKVDANYFNILAGNIFAENAEIECGAFWIANTGSYAGEGNVSINIWESTLTSSGNLKAASTHDAGVYIEVYDSVVSFVDFDGYGACELDAKTTLSVNGESAELTVKNMNSNGTVELYDGGAMKVTGTLTNGNELSLADTASLEAEKIAGAGTVIIDAADMTAGNIATITGDASDFTGTFEVINNDTLDAEIVDGKIVLTEKTVAEVNGVKYTDLQAAIDAAGEGDTVTLLADVALSDTVKILADKTVTLDLNGKTIDGTGNVRIALMSYGDLTLKDSSAEQTGVIKAGIGTAGNAVNICAGSFTMESGSIYSLNNAILIDEEDAVVNIKGGKITAEPGTNNSAVFYVSSTSATKITITGGEMVGYNGILLWNNTEVEMTSGSIEGQGTEGVGIQGNGSRDNTAIAISGGSVTGGEVGIYHPQGGTLTISDDAVISGGTGIVVKGGNVTISGGTINGTGAAGAYAPVGSGFKSTGDALYVEHYDNSTNSENYGTPVVTVTGGVFNSANGAAVASYANLNNAANGVAALEKFISGGTFNKTPAAELAADGFEFAANGDGTYGVGTLPEAEVKDLGKLTVDEYSVYNGSGLSDGGEPIDLTIAMEFVAKDGENTAGDNAFADYITDFYITMSGMSGDSFVADGCYLAGHYGDFGWVMIPLDGMTIENGKVYPVITSVGFEFTYEDICTSVKDFKCGIYVTPEVLAANPELTVNLTLALSEDVLTE
ncbi:MAG: hypothetical protein IJA11_04960, partial [Oscillospiraceae bacterium]|nr:hypothetical protein [Oscillospiraceae bacterium]